MRTLLLSILLLTNLLGFSQGYTVLYIPVTTAHDLVDTNTILTSRNIKCELYLPARYNSVADSMCLLISLVGEPQNTFTIADNYGPGFYLTSDPRAYDSIISPVDNHIYGFITLQNCWDSITKLPCEAQFLPQIARYMQAHYRIFKRRVYLTGFSQGGSNTVDIASLHDSTAKYFNGYVPQSAGNHWQGGGNLMTWVGTHFVQSSNPPVFENTSALFIRYGAGMWWQHGTTDNVYNVQGAYAYRDSMWAYFTPHSNFNLTTGNWGHGNWNFIWSPTTPPDNTQSPYTVPQWLLQFGSGTASLTPPVATKYFPIISFRLPIKKDEELSYSINPVK